MQLFARHFVIRNCGRFLHVASDYGSMYTTHAHLSGEMLYAGLSRERTRLARDFTSLAKRYDFFADFALDRWPVWFTPAMLVDNKGQILAKSKAVSDVHQFNSMREGVPGIQSNDKLPKFGSMETILPDNRFGFLAFSHQHDLLDGFETGNVYWMGKKRTMFEIVNAADTALLPLEQGSCQTPFLQVRPHDAGQFTRLHVLATTQRYVLLSGTTRDGAFWRLPTENISEPVRGVPEFALKTVIEHFQHGE